MDGTCIITDLKLPEITEINFPLIVFNDSIFCFVRGQDGPDWRVRQDAALRTWKSKIKSMTSEDF